MVKGSRSNKSRTAHRNKRSMSQRKRRQNEKLKLCGKVIADEQRKGNGETILPDLINTPIQSNKPAVDWTNVNEPFVKLEVIDFDKEMDKCQSQISQSTTSTNLNVPVTTGNNRTYSTTSTCPSTQPTRTDYRDVTCKKSTVELPNYVTLMANRLSVDSSTNICQSIQSDRTHYRTTKTRINMPMFYKKSTIELPHYVTSMETWLSADSATDNCKPTQPAKTHYRASKTHINMPVVCKKSTIALPNYVSSMENWLSTTSTPQVISPANLIHEEIVDNQYKECYYRYCSPNFMDRDSGSASKVPSNDKFSCSSPRCDVPLATYQMRTKYQKRNQRHIITRCEESELTSVSHADSTIDGSLDTLEDHVRIKEEVFEESEETGTDVVGRPVVTCISHAGFSLDVPSDKFDGQVLVKEEVCEEPEENQISALYRSAKTYAQRQHGIKQSHQQSKLINSEVAETNMRILHSNAPKALNLLNTRQSTCSPSSLKNSETEQREFNEDYYSRPATFLGCNIEDVQAGGNINVSTHVAAGSCLDNSLVTTGGQIKIKEEVFEESEDAVARDNTNVSTSIGHAGFHLDNSLVTSGDKVKIKEEVFEEPENNHTNSQHRPMDTCKLAQKQMAPVNPVAIEPSTRISCRNISGYSTESVPSLSVRGEKFVQSVKSELLDSPERMDISSDAVPKNHLTTHVTRILRNPTTQWNSCSSAVTTQTVTTFASTSNKPICTSTAALGKICFTSVVTTQNSKTSTLGKSAQMQLPVAGMTPLIKLPSSVTVTAFPPLGKHVTANKLPVIESSSTVIVNPSSKRLKTNNVPSLNSSPSVRVITIPSIEKQLLTNMSSALNLPSALTVTAVPSSGKRSMENLSLSIDLQPTSTVATASSSGKQNFSYSAATITSTQSSIKILKANTVSSLSLASLATATLPSPGAQTMASKDSSLNSSSPITAVKVPTSRKHIANMNSLLNLPPNVTVVKVPSLKIPPVANVSPSTEPPPTSAVTATPSAAHVPFIKTETTNMNSLQNLPPNVTVVKMPSLKKPPTANVGPSTESLPNSTVTAPRSAAHVPHFVTKRKAYQCLDGKYIADSSFRTYSKPRSGTVYQKPHPEPTSESRATTETTTRIDKSHPEPTSRSRATTETTTRIDKSHPEPTSGSRATTETTTRIDKSHPESTSGSHAATETTTRIDKSIEAIKTSAFPKEISDYILSEKVTRKLEHILPDSSFVCYLADPDFYFFVSLMPLVQLLSRQQRLRARAQIKKVIYALSLNYYK